MGSAGDRLGHKNALTICFSLLSAALFWLLFAKEPWTLYLFAVIFGFSYSGIASLQSPIIAEMFGLDFHGLVLGVIEFCVTVGETIGPVLAGYIFDVTSSYQFAFPILAIFAAIGLVLISLLRLDRQEDIHHPRS